MQRFRRLLIAVGLDDLDEATVQYAQLISQMAESRRVYFAHVAEELELLEAARARYSEYFETGSDEVESRMRDLVRHHFNGPSQAEIHFEVAVGAPIVELLRLIKQHSIDLVVVGKSAEKRDGGSLPEKIARKAPCSVMVVRQDSEPRITKILVPFDFSEHSLAAVVTAVAFAKASGVEQVHAAHAFQVPPVYTKIAKTYEQFVPEVRQMVEEEFNEFKKRLELGDIQIGASFFPEERPSKAIEKAIAAVNPDLVVMGARGRTDAAAFLLGSVTEQVIRRAPVPLLAVKKKGEGLGVLEAFLAG